MPAPWPRGGARQRKLPREAARSSGSQGGIGEPRLRKPTQRPRDLVKAVRLGMMHQPAPPARKAVAVDLHEIDIGSPQSRSVFENPRSLVHHRPEDAADDGRLVPIAPGPAPSLLRNDAGDRRGRPWRAVARRVVVPAAAALLPEALDRREAIGNRRKSRLAAGTGGTALEGGDIQPAEVLRLEWSHRQPEGAHGGIDGGRCRAAEQQPLGLGPRHLENPVADETVRDTRAYGDFVEHPRQRETGRQHVGRRRLRGHDFEKLHHLRRAEEMQPEKPLPAPDVRGDPFGIEIGCVRRENGVSATERGEPSKDIALHVQILEDRLDDQIRLRDRCIIRRARDACKALGRKPGGDAPAFHRPVEDCAQPGKRPFHRRLVTLDQDERKTGVKQRRGDAGSHGAAADHRRRTDRVRLDAGKRRWAPCGALGVKNVAQGIAGGDDGDPASMHDAEGHDARPPCGA